MHYWQADDGDTEEACPSQKRIGIHTTPGLRDKSFHRDMTEVIKVVEIKMHSMINVFLQMLSEQSPSRRNHDSEHARGGQRNTER